MQEAGTVEELKKKDVYNIKCKHNTENPKWTYWLEEPKELKDVPVSTFRKQWESSLTKR